MAVRFLEEPQPQNRVKFLDEEPAGKVRFVDEAPLENMRDSKTTLGGLATQFAIGAGNAAAFSVPELAANEEFEKLTSDDATERFARGAGTVVGSVVGVPGLVVKLGSKLALKGLAKSAPKFVRLAQLADRARKGTNVAKMAGKAKLAQDVVESAGAAGLFEAVNPSTPIEDKPQKVLQGMAGGAAFGVVANRASKFARSIIDRNKKLPEKTKSAIDSVTEPPSTYTATGQKVSSNPRASLVPSMQRQIPKEAKSIIQDLEKSQTKILAADRGVIPSADQVNLAKSIKVDNNFWQNLKPGTTANAETMFAMRMNLADRILKLGPKSSQDEIAQFTDDLIKADAVASEVGRTLGSLNTAQSMAADQLRFLKNQFELLDPQAKGVAEKMFKQFQAPGFWDKFMEYRTASLLTSPFTHLRNIVGNTIPRLFNPTKKVVSGFANRIESGLTGKQRQVFAREGMADVLGVIHGVRPAIRNALKALASEDYISNSRLIEAVKHNQAIGGITGKIVRSPFRALAAMDEFYSTLGHNASLYSQATRQVLKEGRKNISRRTAELIKNPTVEMLERARVSALEDTFRQPLGPAAKHMQMFLEKSKLGKFVVPFFRTPVNLFKWTFDRGPTSILSKSNWKAILKGTPEQRADAVAKMALGQGISAGILMQVLDGNITGRLSGNRNERAALMRQGIMPYSIKMGDKYVSYRSYEPVSSWIALVANAGEISKERGKIDENKVGVIVGETVKMLKDQSFLRGISDLTNALDDPERYGQQFIQNAATSLVPTGVGYLARLQDPVIREPDSIPAAIRARLPGFSKGVPPRLDLWGRPITKEGTLMQRALLPSGTVTSKPDLTEQELLSLEKFPQKITKRYRGLDLTTTERNLVTVAEGRIIKPLLDRLVSGEQWARMTPEEQEQTVNRVFYEVRKNIRTPFFAKKFFEKFKGLNTREEKIQLMEKFFNKKIERNQ